MLKKSLALALMLAGLSSATLAAEESLESADSEDAISIAGETTPTIEDDTYEEADS